MLEQLVGPFLQSGEGASLLKELQGQGLSPQQATAAVTATAEGASAQAAQGGMASLGGLLGGLAGGAPGGGPSLGGLAGMLGGAATPAAAPAPGQPGAPNPLVALIAPVVAQKTGLSPAVAQVVVTLALPKLMSLLSGAQAPGAAGAAPTAGGLGGVLGGLLG